jgi:kinesin family protein 18/19
VANQNTFAQAAQNQQAKEKEQKEKPAAKSKGNKQKPPVVGSSKNNDILKKDHHDSNMVVAVRLRPMSSKELQDRRETDIISIQDKMIVIMDKVELECMDDEKKKMDVLHRSKEMRFFFDRIFDKKSTTEEVYKGTCSHLVPSVINGYNACVFAYGTTGSGKTHTMTGNINSLGLNVHVLRELFITTSHSKEKVFEIKMSYVEIYNEVIRDLLLPNCKDTYLDLRDDPDKGVVLAGVTEFIVTEPNEVINLLTIGNRRRTTESTQANAESSRSHAICQIMLVTKDKIKNTAEEVLCGKLSLVDLAGSERGTVTQN